jgi:hypothetical protein
MTRFLVKYIYVESLLMFWQTYIKLKKECDSVLIERHKEVMQVECEAYLTDDKRDGDCFFFKFV